MSNLSISQRQGIISLIPNKDKDLLSLNNWRPNSLLNRDYKIATKCIANWLEIVLLLLIGSNQTGYMKGTFIGENIRLIAQHENDQRMIFFLDLKKAFDLLEWNYLFRVLEEMNFGPGFRNWVHTFYHNISSCIVNNGHASEFFPQKGESDKGARFLGCFLLLP